VTGTDSSWHYQSLVLLALAHLDSLLQIAWFKLVTGVVELTQCITCALLGLSRLFNKYMQHSLSYLSAYSYMFLHNKYDTVRDEHGCPMYLLLTFFAIKLVKALTGMPHCTIRPMQLLTER